jgi:hypothetical protein
MTPNTTLYMILGFAVILTGVLAYALSLVARFKKIGRKIK